MSGFTRNSWLRALALALALASCSKAEKDPEIFLPRVLSPTGEDLDAARARACDPSRVNLSDNFLTSENFTAMFNCANYDRSLNGMQALMTHPEFPKFIENVNLILKNEHTKTLRETLADWLEDGPGGQSRVDRLLPFLASMIKNPSFQDFLPVLSNILQNGRTVWSDLLPGLGDVIYTERFPDTLDDAFDIFTAFNDPATPPGTPPREGDTEDYATGIKDLARFLKTDIDGKTASRHALELADEIRELQPDGTSLHQFLEHMLEFGSVDEYFLNAGFVRGELVSHKVNDNPDDPGEACPDLNDTPEHRQQCAHDRVFRLGPNGEDAPLTQLAGLLVELQQPHFDFVPKLAQWFTTPANGRRMANTLTDYVVRLQTLKYISTYFNVASYLTQYALKNNLDPNGPLTGAQFSDFTKAAFAHADYAAWLLPVVDNVNHDAFGERNAALLHSSPLPADISELYSMPEVAELAKSVIPEGGTATLANAISKFKRKQGQNAFQVEFRGKKQALDKHFSDLWSQAVKTGLGEGVVLDYAIELAQSFVTTLSNDFKEKHQPLAEWYFNSPYGSPDMTEMVVGYALGELDLLSKYHKHKQWLRTDFADEVFGANADDKRAWQLLVDQVPNIILYVRSGLARSGGDLTRAMAKDTNGYLVKAYVSLIVKATERGWVKRGVRLLEAYNDATQANRRVRPPMSDDIDKRRDYKKAVEAIDRILRSLTQPERRDDYSTTTLSRLLVPLRSIVSEARRGETERFLLSSADELLKLSDDDINRFMRDLHVARPAGSAGQRRETYRAAADMLRNPNCPEVVMQLAGLFQDNAVKPALDFLAEKIEDGSLPKVLLFIRRLLGFAR